MPMEAIRNLLAVANGGEMGVGRMQAHSCIPKKETEVAAEWQETALLL